MYAASAGLSIATQSASTVFYPLTDHNRQPLNLGYDIIEKTNRMASGTMRKYVVAKKRTLHTSWSDIPSGTGVAVTPRSASTISGMTMTADGNYGGAWMKSFYEANVFKPVYVRVVHSQDSFTNNSASTFYPSPSSGGVEYFWAFITDFSYDVSKRLVLTDLVNVSIGLTEI